jgi:hypothetical protein
MTLSYTTWSPLSQGSHNSHRSSTFILGHTMYKRTILFLDSFVFSERMPFTPQGKNTFAKKVDYLRDLFAFSHARESEL